MDKDKAMERNKEGINSGVDKGKQYHVFGIF